MTPGPIDRINQANQTGDYEHALMLSEQGIAREPANASFWIGKGNALYGLKRLDEAAAAYQTAAAVVPSDALPLANLAGVYYEQRRISEGLAACVEAIRRDPENVNALIHQGNFFMLSEDYPAALKSYEEAEKAAPDDALILFNKANVLTELAQYEQAEALYIRLAGRNPADADTLYALANVQEKAEKYKQAAETYLRLLSLDETPTLHITLGGCLYNLLLQKQDIFPILDVWLSKFPNNPVALHTLKTVDRLNPADRAAEDYIRELFDAFADSFDSVLEGLDYQAPALIAEAAGALCLSAPAVLDLGCGTGLCGLRLKEKVKPAFLTGVDLSAGMLAKAKERGLYDELIQADITVFSRENRYDLAVCADVLTYLGDLSAVFKNVSDSLKQGGVFIFSISEDKEVPDSYEMELSGRFKHGENYIRTVLHDSRILQFQRVGLRKELEETVPGLLVMAQKI